MPILVLIVLLWRDFVVDLGMATYAIDTKVCEPTEQLVRSGGKSVRLTIRGSFGGKCRFECSSFTERYECEADADLLVVTVDGARNVCHRRWLVEPRPDVAPDLVWQGEMRNGLREGLWTGWRYGQRSREAREAVWYVKGKRNGPFFSYRDPKTHGSYRDDEKFGYWMERESEGWYLGGRRFGLWIVHGGGTLTATMYNEGLRNGLELQFKLEIAAPDWLRVMGNYENDDMTGVWKTFAGPKRLIREQRFVRGHLNGRSREWNLDGRLLSDEDYFEGAVVEHTHPKRRPTPPATRR